LRTSNPKRPPSPFNPPLNFVLPEIPPVLVPSR
jgi:hypothetical protein